MSEKLNLHKNIHDLLRTNEIVVVPQFGAFVADYENAKLEQFSVLPPSRKVRFNKNVIKDDGLLIQAISAQINQDYLKSKMVVAEAVYGWKRDLSYGETLIIDNVGELTLTNEGHLEFKDYSNKNLQGAFFGLENARLAKVEKKIEKELKVVPVLLPDVKVEKKESVKVVPLNSDKIEQEETVKVLPLAIKSSNWNGRSVAAGLAIVISLGIGILGGASVKNNSGGNLASMFSTSSSTKSVVKEEVKPSTKIQKITRAEEFFTGDELEQLADEMLIDSQPEKIISTETIPANEVETSSNENFKYHLVAGCFSSEQNADKLVIDLRSKGFKANKIGQTSSGLYRVAYGSFKTKLTALKKLASIKLSQKVDSWILSEELSVSNK